MSGEPPEGYERAPAGSGPDAGVVDVSAGVGHPVVTRLLSLGLDDPSAPQLAALAAWVRDGGRALGWSVDGTLVGAIAARPAGYGEAEVMSIGVDVAHRRDGIGRSLVRALAEDLAPRALIGTTDGTGEVFWRGVGALVQPLDGHPGRFRFVRRQDADVASVGERWFSGPRIHHEAARRVQVDLPPEGNTLPLVPEALRDVDLPAFVLEWVVAADEVGQLLQHLLPDEMPATTPPAELRATLAELLGPVSEPAWVRSAAREPWGRGSDGEPWGRGSDGEPWGRGSDGEPWGRGGDVAGLPVGVHVPFRALEVVAAAARIGAWIEQGWRVRAWAEEHGFGDRSWIADAPDDIDV